MDSLMTTHVGTNEPEEEIVHDPFALDMDVVSAIRLIQKNERGRQGRYRIMLILKGIKKQKLDLEQERKMKEGVIERKTRDQQENEATLFIQRRLRGILARKRIEDMRQEEMVFLGMARKPRTKEELRNDPVERMKKTQQDRKLKQQQFMNQFEDAKKDLKEEITENEGLDIQEHMLKERRDWVQEYKALHANKPPTDLKDFYERLNTETPLSPEEEELKKL